MDKVSNDKTAPAKHKIPVGQAETKTTKSQTATSTKTKAIVKAASKSDSEASTVKVTRKPAAKAIAAAANAQPIKKSAKPAAARSNTTTKPAASKTAIAKSSSAARSTSPKEVTLGMATPAASTSTRPTSQSASSQRSAQRTKQPQTRRWWMIGGIILAVFAVIGILIAIFLSENTPVEDDSDSTDAPNSQLEINYNQKVTNPLGGTFSPNYELGSDRDFSVRFADLACSDDACSNVRNVKFAGKVLASDAYQVKRGSVIIVLLADTLKDLKVGQYTLSFEITEDGETQLIGLKVKVVDSGETCPDGQTKQDGQCVATDDEKTEKPEEETTKPEDKDDSNKTESNGAGDSSTNQGSGSGSQPDVSQTEQQKCEAKAGPNRVLTIRWLSDAEKKQYATDSNYQDGDEIAAGGVAWVGAKMKWVDNRCQPSVSGAENVGIGGGDWLLPRTDPTLPFATQSHPGQNFVVWYYPDGSSQLEFVNGDPMKYISNHF